MEKWVMDVFFSHTKGEAIRKSLQPKSYNARCRKTRFPLAVKKFYSTLDNGDYFKTTTTYKFFR